MLNEHGHSIALWHSISQVSAWTVGMIAVLFASYKWLRTQPWLLERAEGVENAPQNNVKPTPLNFLNKKSSKAKAVEIKIESRKAVDGKNALVVAKVGSERFLLASTHDGLSMLSRLEQGETTADYCYPSAAATETQGKDSLLSSYASSPELSAGRNTHKAGVSNLFPPRYPAPKSFSFR